MRLLGAFGAGVVVGLLLPWAVAALADWWTADDGPERTAARARDAWGVKAQGKRDA